MYRLGHIGITAGTASAGAAYWLHREFDKQPKAAGNSIEKRLTNRGPAVLKGLSAVAIAEAVSLLVDRDFALNLGHRTATHSVVTAWTSRSGIIRVGDRIADKIEATAEKRDGHRLLEDLADQIRESAGLYGMAVAAGIGLHSIGDVPTGGVGGSALQLLWPISSHSFSLGLISAASPQLNSALFTGGVSIAAVAWATVLARILFSDETWRSFQQTVADAGSRIRSALVSIGRNARRAAASFANRVRKYVRRLFTEIESDRVRGIADGGKPISRKPARRWTGNNRRKGTVTSEGGNEYPRQMKDPRPLALESDVPPHLRSG